MENTDGLHKFPESGGTGSATNKPDMGAAQGEGGGGGGDEGGIWVLVVCPLPNCRVKQKQQGGVLKGQSLRAVGSFL